MRTRVGVTPRFDRAEAYCVVSAPRQCRIVRRLPHKVNCSDRAAGCIVDDREIVAARFTWTAAINDDSLRAIEAEQAARGIGATDCRAGARCWTNGDCVRTSAGTLFRKGIERNRPCFTCQISCDEDGDVARYNATVDVVEDTTSIRQRCKRLIWPYGDRPTDTLRNGVGIERCCREVRIRERNACRLRRKDCAADCNIWCRSQILRDEEVLDDIPHAERAGQQRIVDNERKWRAGIRCFDPLPTVIGAGIADVLVGFGGLFVVEPWTSAAGGVDTTSSVNDDDVRHRACACDGPVGERSERNRRWHNVVDGEVPCVSANINRRKRRTRLAIEILGHCRSKKYRATTAFDRCGATCRNVQVPRCCAAVGIDEVRIAIAAGGIHPRTSTPCGKRLVERDGGCANPTDKAACAWCVEKVVIARQRRRRTKDDCDVVASS
ncbi:hypothetical protein HRbin20_01539 [bacterium HR20]|nr:hypothetical protein HRbin20_01539 [bacterium HR20]